MAATATVEYNDRDQGRLTAMPGDYGGDHALREMVVLLKPVSSICGISAMR
jgi:hypothetical protein